MDCFVNRFLNFVAIIPEQNGVCQSKSTCINSTLYCNCFQFVGIGKAEILMSQLGSDGLKHVVLNWKKVTFLVLFNLFINDISSVISISNAVEMYSQSIVRRNVMTRRFKSFSHWCNLNMLNLNFKKCYKNTFARYCYWSGQTDNSTYTYF